MGALFQAESLRTFEWNECALSSGICSFGLFTQEPGHCLQHHANVLDESLATEAAGILFDTQENCELVILWDYVGREPRQVWRLTPTILPRWNAKPHEAAYTPIPGDLLASDAPQPTPEQEDARLPSAAKAMKRQQITITTREGSVQVDGYVDGPLAVHRYLCRVEDGKPIHITGTYGTWTIAHLRSGYSVVTVDKLAAAKALLRELLTVPGIDWTEEQPYTNRTEEAKVTMREIAKKYLK